MTATSRYWDSPTAGMPPDLAEVARKNLAATDKSISGFNDRAKYFPTPTTPPVPALPVAPTPAPPSSFQFGLNGATNSSQLTLPSVPSATNAVSRITPSAPTLQTDWRLQGVPSQLGQTSVMDKAYHQISSAPPEQRQQYGWGQ